MRYRILGKSGLRVSELCLGTMTFGEEFGWGASADASCQMYRKFRDAGGNFIDTANIYTAGTSEKLLGQFMEGHREEVVLATKYACSAASGDPNAAGNHRKSMVQSVEESLRRLRTDYIDLYWLHIWDQITPAEEVVRGLEDLVRQGKVLNVGASNVPAWYASRAVTLAELRGWSQFIALQLEYSLIERTPEREQLPMACELNLGVLAWSPLAGGLLTGKYQQGKSDGRFSTEDMKSFMAADDRSRNIVGCVQSIAKRTGASPSQIALCWIRSKGRNIIPIIGARTISQLEDNLKCLKVTLEPALLDELDQVSQIQMGYPVEFFRKDRIKTLSFGGMRDQIDF